MNGKIKRLENLNPAKSSIAVGDYYEGKFYNKPVVGQPFTIGNYHTSKVVKLMQDHKFQTENSVYQLQLW